MRFTRFLRSAHGGDGIKWKVDPKYKTAKTVYEPYIADPAWEKWANMKRDYYKGFRITKRNWGWVFFFNIGMPVVFYIMVARDTRQERDSTALEGMATNKGNRKIEDLQTNKYLKYNPIYDEPEIKISTWNDKA